MSRELDLPRRKPGSANSYLSPAAWHLAISPAILRVNRGPPAFARQGTRAVPEDQGMAIPGLARPRSLGNLLVEEPLRDEIKTTAGWFLDRHKGKESIPAI